MSNRDDFRKFVYDTLVAITIRQMSISQAQRRIFGKAKLVGTSHIFGAAISDAKPSYLPHSSI